MGLQIRCQAATHSLYPLQPYIYLDLLQHTCLFTAIIVSSEIFCRAIMSDHICGQTGLTIGSVLSCTIALRVFASTIVVLFPLSADTMVIDAVSETP